MKNVPFVAIVCLFFFSSCEGPRFSEKVKGTIFSVPNTFWMDTVTMQSIGYTTCDSTAKGVIVSADSLIYFFPSHDSTYTPGKPVYIYFGKQVKSIPVSKWKTTFGADTLKYGAIWLEPQVHDERKFILGWLQMTISLCVIFIMLGIWIKFHIQKTGTIQIEQLIEELKQDKGILFLSLALLFWAAIGIINVYNTPSQKLINDILTRVFSLTNNMFFLLALPFFRHGVSHFKENKSLYGAIAILLVFISFVIVLAISIDPGKYVKVMKLFDICYSGIVLALLGYILYRSFSARGFTAISRLTVLISMGVVFAQLIPRFPQIVLVLGNVGHIIYHTTFLMTTTLLVALMFSWYNEEREQAIVTKLSDLIEQMTDKTIPPIKKIEALSLVLAKSDIKLVINVLLNTINQDEFKGNNVSDEIIQASQMFNASERQYKQGIINFDEFSLVANKVAWNLQDLIEKLFNKDSDLKAEVDSIK